MKREEYLASDREARMAARVNALAAVAGTADGLVRDVYEFPTVEREASTASQGFAMLEQQLLTAKPDGADRPSDEAETDISDALARFLKIFGRRK